MLFAVTLQESLYELHIEFESVETVVFIIESSVENVRVLDVALYDSSCLSKTYR